MCAIGSGPETIRATERISTTTPDETLGAVAAFFAAEGPIEGLGIASFGPLDLDPTSATYGSIMSTPKPNWSGTDVLGALSAAVPCRTGIDLDVNGSAVGEHRWGAARGLTTFVYVTVGTGIGVGAILDGRVYHGGVAHPEVGHVRVPRADGDEFEGTCPFHGDCLEGMAAGPAIEARWASPPHALGDTLPAAVELEAWYLGAAFANLTLAFAPQRIVVGGGIAKLPGLMDLVRTRLVDFLGGYVPGLTDTSAASLFVVPPDLGDRSGVLGAIAIGSAAA